MLYRDLGDPQPPGYDTKRDANDPREVQKRLAGSDAWSTHIIQDYTGSDVAKSALGPEWYNRKVGVRISMLGDEGETTVFGGRPPIGTNGPIESQLAYGETGGAWLNVRRETENTNFVALHQPFEQGQVPTTTFTKLADTSTGENQVVAVAVSGKGGVENTTFDDRIMLATGPMIEAERSVSANDEHYRFLGHLWIRITADAVIAVGHPRQIKLPVSGSPKLILNGEEVAEASDGMLSWEGSTDEPDYSKQL